MHAQRPHRDAARSGRTSRPASVLVALRPEAGRQGHDLGPFGEFFAQDTKGEMVYIGGGAGMAPLRSHIFDLFLA